MNRLLAAVGTVLFVCAGCGGGEGADTKVKGDQVFAESQECRDNAKPLTDAIATIKEATDIHGAADMEALTTAPNDDDPDPLGALSAPMYTEKFGLFCSKKVRELETRTDLLFGYANNIFGNYCFADLEPAKCDEQKMATWMVAGVNTADEFMSALERKVSASEAATSAQPAGTVNLTGSLRLYDGIETARDGDETYCYGKGIYDNLAYGTTITVTDAAGTKVALGELDQGYPQGSPISKDGNGLCVFPLNIEAVPDKPGVLSLDLDGITGPDFTVQKYKSEPSTLVLTLGEPG